MLSFFYSKNVSYLLCILAYITHCFLAKVLIFILTVSLCVCMNKIFLYEQNVSE